MSLLRRDHHWQFVLLAPKPPLLHSKTCRSTPCARRSGLRLKAAAIAKVTGEKAAATTAQLRQKVEDKDWTKEREYLGRTQKNLQGCA